MTGPKGPDPAEGYYGDEAAQPDEVDVINQVAWAVDRARKPKGTKNDPGTTCRDLLMRNDNKLESGKYFVDPNGESVADAFEVYCNMETGETCLHPEDNTFKQDRWTKETTPDQWFMREIVNKDELDYGEMKRDQYHFLHMHSIRARQNITYNCLNSNAYGVKLSTFDGSEMYADHELRKYTYRISLDGCQTKNNQWGKTTFEVDTSQTELLPITDVAVQDVGEENQKFGLEIGPVCFS